MRMYVAFDGRAGGGDSDVASVLEVLGDFKSDEAAIEICKRDWDEAAIFSYTKNGVFIENEQFVTYYNKELDNG